MRTQLPSYTCCLKMENSKAIWDAVQDNIFVDICLEEIAAHDIIRERYLSRVGFTNITWNSGTQFFYFTAANYASSMTPALIPSWNWCCSCWSFPTQFKKLKPNTWLHEDEL